MVNVVTALASTFLIGSSLFFHLTRTLIKDWMSLMDEFEILQDLTKDMS